MPQNQSTGGQKPSVEFQAWPVKIAMWTKQAQKDGRTFEEHTYTLSKSFKRQGSDKYEDQRLTLFGDDLLKAMELLRQAFDAGELRTRIPE